MKLAILLVCLAFFSRFSVAEESYVVEGASLRSPDGRRCRLEKAPGYAIESYDKSAVLISETDYVAAQDLRHCSEGHAVRVRSISNKVGVLSDINLSSGIYIALDFIDVRPMVYLATVARIGSSKNLVSLDGAYIAGTKLNVLQRNGFDAPGGAGSSLISPSGRYVAPNGHIDCKESAYPGVWDIHRNRRVMATDTVCARLFN